MSTQFNLQEQSFRDPNQITGGRPKEANLIKDSLKKRVSKGFIETLNKLNITLLVTREYEHLVLALNVTKNQKQKSEKLASSFKLHTSFHILPHPSGLVTNKITGTTYIASTRNPNQIWEFTPSAIQDLKLFPRRTKIFPGRYYFHDLALINNELYANSVGQNAIVKIDFNHPVSDPPIWWPKSMEINSKPDFSKNFIQLNSIAAGDDIKHSFFSASLSKPGSKRPGHKKFPVNKNGVIFDGNNREVCATGLTRPHSCRQYKKNLFVDNSGYGEFGTIRNGKFEKLITLPGWTRGLCIINDIAFIGISKVLPRFEQYAPGLKSASCRSGIIAYDLSQNRIIGSLYWPNGNQIFAIDYLPTSISTGFNQTKFESSLSIIQNTYYNY